MSLTQERIDANYDLYIGTLRPFVSEELISFIDSSDFKTAPASTKYHGDYEGGLCEHSLGVLKGLRFFATLGKGLYSEAQIVRAALLHDLCKVNTYRKEPGRRRNPDGVWEDCVRWVVEDDYPAGHGSKSVALILEHGTQLTHDEVMAITHHMGAYNLSGMDASIYGKATEQCPLVLFIHWADLTESKVKPFVQEHAPKPART